MVLILSCIAWVSVSVYPHCWLYTLDTPYLADQNGQHPGRRRLGHKTNPRIRTIKQKKKKKYSQQVPLKSQRHRSLRVHDCVACLRDIHVEDGLAVHLSGGGLGAQRRDQPGF